MRFAATFRWPGPLHEGGGVAQLIVDPSASEEQREALIKILSGEEQEPTTVFNIIGSTIEKEEDTLFTPIDMAWDWDARSGHITIPEVAEGSFEPIKASRCTKAAGSRNSSSTRAPAKNSAKP